MTSPPDFEEEARAIMDLPARPFHALLALLTPTPGTTGETP